MEYSFVRTIEFARILATYVCNICWSQDIKYNAGMTIRIFNDCCLIKSKIETSQLAEITGWNSYDMVNLCDPIETSQIMFDMKEPLPKKYNKIIDNHFLF